MLKNLIASKYLGNKNIAALRSRFSHSKPFPHLVLREFFSPSLIKPVANALKQEAFVYQESDLFSFSQTNDLKNMHKHPISEFYHLLNSIEFKEYLSKITNIEAFGSIDCSGFLYKKNDYLLPHDDQFDKRKISFTMHLGDDFSKRDGGAFELFAGNKIVMSYPPQFNTFVFFQLSKGNSVHQISELLSDNVLHTISGWFNDK